jgi:hypothetical protein
MSKEQLDILLNKWISRKLLVFVVACGGLFSGYLTLLLLISIIYTSMKIWDWVQIRINGKDEDNSKKNAQD